MFRQSSYLVGLEMAASGDTFADSGLEPAKFAGVGGCFPINLKGRGFIGAIAVSGMEQQEDHWLVVDSISQYLGVAVESVLPLFKNKRLPVRTACALRNRLAHRLCCAPGERRGGFRMVNLEQYRTAERAFAEFCRKSEKNLTIAARSFIMHRAPKHRRSVMRICFKHAQVWKDGSLRLADILVSDGRIVSIGDRVSCSTDTVCNEVHNAVIFPGFVDVHVHLREPGFSYKETVRTGTLAAAHGGFAHVAAMPNLNPVPDCKASLEEELRRIRESACVHVHPYGAISVGQKGEQLADLDAMVPEVIAFSDDGKGVQSESLMREAMEQCRRLGKILAAHCEDNRLLRGGYIHDGAYAKTHSHRGICSESEWGQIARDVRLAEETGCAYHVCHVSTKESVSIIREAKRRGVNVTCETGPHYLTFTEDDLQEDGRFKMNPPLRSREDRDALIEGLLDGTIDMIVTDHAPHSREEKARGLEKSAMGVVGLETSFAACYTSFVKPGVLPLGKLMDLMHDAPMRRFGCGTELAIGQPADLTVFNLSESYVVEPEQFLSMGRATPFAGVTLTGVCKMTMIDGKIVWKEETL